MVYEAFVKLMADYNGAGVPNAIFIAEYVTKRDSLLKGRPVTPENLDLIMDQALKELREAIPQVAERFKQRRKIA